MNEESHQEKLKRKGLKLMAVGVLCTVGAVLSQGYGGRNVLGLLKIVFSFGPLIIIFGIISLFKSRK